MATQWIALLGKRDVPTDGVRDYCNWLSRSLARDGCDLQLVPVPWAKIGWFQALLWLWRESVNWKDKWIILQYTVYGWSQRGLPIGFLAVIWLLKQRRVRLAVVFHDPQGHAGDKLRYRWRRAFQQWVMQKAYAWVDRSICTVPLD